ncbi:MAG TPA: hypothetical protein VLV89_02425 [Candidatus Acidoferrum sp.]|nr:hypothetical protein [Candidatus Acidoferrum sp.]
MSPSQSRDKYWHPWIHHPALRTGVRMGIFLSVVLTAWLVLANRVSVLDRLAIVRNAAALTLLFMVALEPVARFRSSARDLLVSGLIGWAIGSLCYFGWTIYFVQLSNRMGPFQVFVLGAAVYILLAVIVWISGMVRIARQHHQLAAKAKLHHTHL